MATVHVKLQENEMSIGLSDGTVLQLVATKNKLTIRKESGELIYRRKLTVFDSEQSEQFGVDTSLRNKST